MILFGRRGWYLTTLTNGRVSKADSILFFEGKADSILWLSLGRCHDDIAHGESCFCW